MVCTSSSLCTVSCVEWMTFSVLHVGHRNARRSSIKSDYRPRRPRLTPSPCSRTGSDALVGILVGAKEEPSSKRGHGDACASAGGVRTATLARAAD